MTFCVRVKGQQKFAYSYLSRHGVMSHSFEAVPAQIISDFSESVVQQFAVDSKCPNQSRKFYLWLHSISNGLGLERLAVEFESRGFRKTSSLKYVK